MDNTTVRVKLSHQAIWMVILTGLGIWIAYQVRDILALFFIVVAIVVTLAPFVNSWSRWMPRGLAIASIYILVTLGIIIISALLLPPLIHQLSDFLNYLQANVTDSASSTAIGQLQLAIGQALRGEGVDVLIRLLNQFQGSLSAVYSSTLGFFGGVVSFITVAIASFYMLLEEKTFFNFLGSFLPHGKVQRVESVVDKISEKMSYWLIGQLFVMVVVGVVTAIALAILGVPYSLLLGLWAGIMEFFPYIGPVLGAVPGVALAFITLGPIKGLVAIAIYFLIQQLENNVLLPKVMGKALGLSPVVIIFALLIGGKLLGFIGLVIAIPIAAALSVIFEEWRKVEVK